MIFYIFFYFFKVYINGDLVQSHKSLSTESKNLTQDWETKAGIGKLDSSLKVKRGSIILPLSVWQLGRRKGKKLTEPDDWEKISFWR